MKRAVARRVPNRFYTRPRVETDVEILEELEQRDLANGATLHWGRVRTTDAVTYYKKIQVADEKEVGVFPARPAGRYVRDAGVLDLAASASQRSPTELRELRRRAARRGARPDRSSAPLRHVRPGGYRRPLHTRPPPEPPPDGLRLRRLPGGVGISRRGYDEFESLARDTLGVITRCPCERGCPACIQSPKCGNWNEPLSKSGAVSFLRYLLGQVDNYPTL